VRTGRIKWYNAFQSHGYIILWDGTEVYFHSSAIRRANTVDQLQSGIDVSFDLIETRGGPEAHNIELIGW
jgi:cold shock CspA family protein